MRTHRVLHDLLHMSFGFALFAIAVVLTVGRVLNKCLDVAMTCVESFTIMVSDKDS